MFQKARDSSVPFDTIERAVKRGTGELEGVDYEQVTYEGYAPNGVALLRRGADRQPQPHRGPRSAPCCTKNGGSLAEPGAVAWQFERKGVVIVPRTVDEDELMMVALEAGAEDLADEGDTWRVTTGPSDLPTVRDALEAGEVPFESADLTMLPSSTVELASAEDAKAVLRLIDLLDDHDDVQDVYANFDIPDDVLQAVSV